MNIELNPKLLDVVEIPNRYLGSEISGVTLGTVVELLGGAGENLLVEVADEDGVPRDLVELPASVAKKVWSAAASDQQTSSAEDGSDEFRKGMLLLQNGLLTEAKKHLEKAFAQEPKFAGTLMNLAIEPAKRGAYDAAIFLYRLVLDLQPENQLTRRNLAATHINRGIQFAKKGVFNKAIEEFGSSLKLEPYGEIATRSQHNLVATYTDLGLRFSEINQYQEAFASYSIAFQINPSDVTRRNLAIALVAIQAAQWEELGGIPPVASFKDPIQMGLTVSECLNVLGATLANLGDLDRARQALSEAIRVDSANELARLNLARIERRDESAGQSRMNSGISTIDLQSYSRIAKYGSHSHQDFR